MSQKPQLTFWQIWNMCFGFMGIQFGFALQNSNVSRIFQTLGADYNNMTVLWVAAPITGLLVQPVVGYFSDNTWNRLGRRRPYFLYGAIVASLSILIMPNSPTLWIAAGMLWVMDASINVSMEPFRAFVGDMLPRSQRALGYAMQSFFIGVGAVVASALPWIMSNWFDVSNTAAAGVIPDAVKYAFYAGGAVFFLAVLWTVLSTREYSPEELAAFAIAEPGGDSPGAAVAAADRPPGWYFRLGLFCLAVGLALTAAISTWIESLDRNLFILSGLFVFFGLCLWLAAWLHHRGRAHHGFAVVMADIFAMPRTMRQLAVVQFFSWFPFFAMWSSTTAAVTSHHFGTVDPTSAAFNRGADWVGVLFAAYNLTAVAAAIGIPFMVRVFNLPVTHMINLFLGGAGFVAFLFIRDPDWLIAPMIGIGFAWASVLSVPYALLSNALDYRKMGLYMGIFNFFIVLPQILAASILGFLVTRFFNGEPVYALVVGGVSMLLAGLMVLRVRQ